MVHGLRNDGLGKGVTTAGWDVESLDGLLITLAINHVFQVACVS